MGFVGRITILAFDTKAYVQSCFLYYFITTAYILSQFKDNLKWPACSATYSLSKKEELNIFEA